MKLALHEQKEKKRLEINITHLENGVNFVDINAAYIDESVTIGEGTTIYPGVILEGNVKIGANCIIGQNTHISDSVIGDETEIESSVIRESKIGNKVTIGPFAHIRPDCEIANKCKVGAFVEVKNSKMGEGSKAPHLAYVGDADVGKSVNLGCGVIFVNYNGIEKFRSEVKDGAFIGCNANIVSPVVIEEDAYIAAGSTVTKNIPKDALCVARCKERIINGWTSKRKLLKK